MATQVTAKPSSVRKSSFVSDVLTGAERSTTVFSWPSRCVCCGDGDDLSRCRLTLPGYPTQVSFVVPYCSVCSGHVMFFRAQGLPGRDVLRRLAKLVLLPFVAFGAVLAGGVLLGFLFGDVVGGVGVLLAFLAFLGALIYSCVSVVRSKAGKQLQARISEAPLPKPSCAAHMQAVAYLGKDTFTFANDSYARLFAEMNDGVCSLIEPQVAYGVGVKFEVA